MWTLQRNQQLAAYSRIDTKFSNYNTVTNKQKVFKFYQIIIILGVQMKKLQRQFKRFGKNYFEKLCLFFSLYNYSMQSEKKLKGLVFDILTLKILSLKV